MVGDQRHKGTEPQPPREKTPLVISVLIHVAVILLVIIGLPHWKSDIQIVDPVPVQLVDNISELATTNKPPVKSPPKKEEKKEPEKKEEKPKPKPQPQDTPPPPDDVLQPPPKDEKLEKQPEKPAEKKPEKKPQEKPKPKPKPEKKQEKKPPKKQEESFESLLKDLAPDDKKEPDTEKTAPKMTEPSPAPQVSRFSNVISMTEMDALRYQLSQCWNIMAGAANSEDLVVEVNVVVNPDRTVYKATIVDQSRYGKDPFFRAAADSAIRALNNPRCTPLNLPPEKYDQWKQMTIVFDPKDML